MSYIQIIFISVVIFPLLAFLITLPYIIYNYNKYGSILFIRTFLIYIFVFYLLSAYFLIILPLPSINEVTKLKTEVQLIPFSFVNDIINTVKFDIKDINTYINIFQNPFVYQAIYNLLLTVPFSIFLRYYFDCKFKKTVFMTFLLSLFFELTQLTGLYFIYPHAYRLFDVDDLIINTFGGVFGYLIAPIFIKFLPSRNELDNKSYQKGQKVTSTKRVFTFLIDLSFIIAFIFIEYFICYFNSVDMTFFALIVISLILFMIIIPLLSNGFTIGCKITNIKIQSDKWYKLLFRNIFFCFYILFPYNLYYLFRYISSINTKFNFIIIILYIVIVFIYIFIILIRNLILHKPYLYESVTNTKMISTISTKKK